MEVKHTMSELKNLRELQEQTGPSRKKESVNSKTEH